MSTNVVGRAWAWRSFVWAGVVASLLAWAWVWFRVGGASVVMVLVAVAAVVFASRGTAGVRAALAGLMVAGFAMFLASLYWMYTLLLQGSQNVSAMEVLVLSVFPWVASVLVLLGSVTGFRQASTTS